MRHETTTKPGGDVIEIAHSKGEICRDILGDLSEWFGIPEAVDDYVRSVEELPMFGFHSMARSSASWRSGNILQRPPRHSFLA